MKNLYFGIFFLIMFTGLGCSSDDDDFTGNLQTCQYNGTIYDRQTSKMARIYQVANFWVLDITVKGKVIRCAPCNLPDEFKIENKSIVINANFHPIPPNAKLVGQPIEITKIH